MNSCAAAQRRCGGAEGVAMRWGLGGLMLLAAAASVAGALFVGLSHLLDPRWGHERNTILLIVVLATAMLTVVGLVLLRNGVPARWPIAVIALIAAAGIIPHYIDLEQRREVAAYERAGLRDLEARTLAGIEARQKELDERIAARRPFEGDEARQFLVFVVGADLTTASGPDYSTRTIPMLRRALEAHILDPNTIVKEPLRADLGPEPLFVNFHRQAHPLPERTVRMRDWTVLKLLVDNGADLSSLGAGPVAADMRKTATPVFGGLYVELK